MHGPSRTYALDRVLSFVERHQTFRGDHRPQTVQRFFDHLGVLPSCIERVTQLMRRQVHDDLLLLPHVLLLRNFEAQLAFALNQQPRPVADARFKFCKGSIFRKEALFEENDVPRLRWPRSTCVFTRARSSFEENGFTYRINEHGRQ